MNSSGRIHLSDPGDHRGGYQTTGAHFRKSASGVPTRTSRSGIGSFHTVPDLQEPPGSCATTTVDTPCVPTVFLCPVFLVRYGNTKGPSGHRQDSVSRDHHHHSNYSPENVLTATGAFTLISGISNKNKRKEGEDMNHCRYPIRSPTTVWSIRS